MTARVPVTLLNEAISKIVYLVMFGELKWPIYLITFPYYFEYNVWVLLATRRTAPGKAAFYK